MSDSQWKNNPHSLEKLQLCLSASVSLQNVMVWFRKTTTTKNTASVSSVMFALIFYIWVPDKLLAKHNLYCIWIENIILLNIQFYFTEGWQMIGKMVALLYLLLLSTEREGSLDLNGLKHPWEILEFWEYFLEEQCSIPIVQSHRTEAVLMACGGPTP